MNTITNAKKIMIGEGSNIKDTFIESEGYVEIGKYVHTGRNLCIFSLVRDYENVDKFPYDKKIIKKQVVIEDFIWIGANVSIIPCVCIGEGAIIGMGAVVSKDIPPCAITVGNPVRIVKYRDIEKFHKLKKEKKFF